MQHLSIYTNPFIRSLTNEFTYSTNYCTSYVLNFKYSPLSMPLSNICNILLSCYTFTPCNTHIYTIYWAIQLNENKSHFHSKNNLFIYCISHVYSTMAYQCTKRTHVKRVKLKLGILPLFTYYAHNISIIFISIS